jgi:nucleoside-diphosphate-sugar epimerase
MARILIAGCGYLGSALGARLLSESHTVWGLRRRAGALPPGLRAIEADLSIPSTLRELPGELDFVVYAVAPGGRDEPLYRAACVDGLENLLEALRATGQHPSRLLFISSTAVYGQEKGEWVDEQSPTEPSHFSGRLLLEGEALALGGPFPGHVLRLGGIYGPRRAGLLDRVRSGRAVYRASPPRYLNRIHLADCVGALCHLLSLPDPAPVTLGVDDDPADERTVLQWMAGSLGAPPPRAAGPEEAEAEARRGRGNKRCKNARLKASGYRFLHPTFREGYRELIESMS